VAGSGAQGAQDGPAASATFNLPTGLALDNAGNLYVCDNNNNMIRKIVLIGGNVTQVAGSLTPSTNDGSGANAGLRFPQGMVYDATNNVLIIADQANYRIRKMTTGGAVTTFAGGGVFIPDAGGHVNATGTDARFYAPYGVALAPSGTLYVADQYNHVIRAITPGGVVSDFAGDPSKPGNDGGGVADGTGTAAKFNKPAGLAVATDGTVYVADQVNNLIRRISPAGEVSTFAGGGSGFTDGKGSSCQFRGPAALVFDKEGDLYVADQANHAIRKIKMASGEVTTILGGPPTGDGPPTQGGFADGQDGKLNEPTGLAYDAASNTLYIADSKNNRIRKVLLP
jgi:sugar lactone lactonase YvrE